MDGAKKKVVPAVVTLRLERLLSLRTSGNCIYFTYGFVTAFVFFTLFLALFNPSSVPFGFSFSSSRTTIPLSSPSSPLSSSSYFLPDPNLCASARFSDYDHRNGSSQEKELNSNDVEQRQVDPPPPLLKVHDDGNVSFPTGSYQQEPDSVSPVASLPSTGKMIQTVGVSGDDAVSTDESRPGALEPEDELEKLLVAPNERNNISAREREIFRQYRYGSNASLVSDLEAERSPHSDGDMTGTPPATLTGENGPSFTGNDTNVVKDDLETERIPDSVSNMTSTPAVAAAGENGTFVGNDTNIVTGDLEKERSPDGVSNMTSTPSVAPAGENGTLTGNATNVVKGNLETEGNPDSVSNMTSTPAVALAGENGTLTGNVTNVMKENDTDVPLRIEQVHGKRREGRREGRRSGWRVKTGPSSEGWRKKTDVSSESARREKPKMAEAIGRDRPKMECDIFDGRWVRDDSYPHYDAGSCPYVETATSCYQNGRPERNYEKWRWQPHGCNIPRLDPKDMLEKLRGKRMAFVGDSLNRNMWRSLICLLWSSLEDKTRMVGVSGQHVYGTKSATVFRFLDYNFTLEFFWSAFLVDEQEISHPSGTVRKKLRLDNMAPFASSYKDADILIFNSGHWWVPAKTNGGKNFYELGNTMYGYLEAERAYLRALMTWADWVDANVNPNKTRVFFRGFSNVHYSGGQWNSGGHCHKEVEPIMNDAYLSPQPEEMRLAEIVMSKMRIPVAYLNITKLTDYRKDAHPSIYTSPKIVPERFQDCSHWCLPGVPDTWNELLYAMLIMKT